MKILNNFSTIALFCMFSFVLGLLINTNCSSKPNQISTITTYKYKDTLILHDTLQIKRYIPKRITNIVYKQDTLYTITMDTIYDSYGYPVLQDSLTINVYMDSIEYTDSPIKKIKWEAQTQGYLVSLIPTITYTEKQLTTTKKIIKDKEHLSLLLGVGNRGSIKTSIGYKDWYIESALNIPSVNRKIKLTNFEFFITKRFKLF